MSRIVFGFLFFSLTTAITSQIEPSAMVAQVGEKKKKKGKNKEPVNPGELKEDTSRVLPVFDPGSHTKEISAMGFTKDKSKLITVGQDFTIQIWNAATGERVDILRLPGYGREKGFDPGRWDVAAVSTDGTRVAIGGQAKFLFDTETKENAPARLILVDIPNRKVARVQLAGNTSPVEGLVFSADGETLAVALAKGVEASARLFLVGGLTDRIAKANPLLRTADCTSITTPHSKPIIDLAFSPNGKQLVLGEYGQLITLWDVPAGAAPKPVVAKEIKAENDSASLNWSPDGKQFVCAWRSGRGSDKDRGIDLWSSDGKPVKSWNMPALSPALSLPASIREARFLDANSIYFVANGTTGDRKNSGSSGSIGSIACILDIASGKARRLTAWADGMIADPVGASTKDGELVALSVTGNTEVLIGRSQGERAFVRCGQRSPIPYIVGWAKAPEAPGFAWTNEYQSKGKERSPDDLRFGFDLTKVAPVGEIRSTDFDITRRKIGEWHFDDNHKKKKEADGRSGMLLKQGAKEVAHFLFPLNTAHTLIPNGDKPPLVAFKKNELNVTVRVLFLFNGDGKLITRLLPDATDFTDIASSPDGRYIIASTGSPRLVVYRTDGSPYPFLSFAQL
ncbi:MAG: hypothetical protein K8T89_02185, partial [Planctomycetes bacterium]|nr:hypothetical protein [Planctomycetota bacterium]